MRPRNLCVLAIVALFTCMATGVVSAATLFEDDFNGTALDAGKWVASGEDAPVVSGGNVTLDSASDDWTHSQIDSISTWTTASDRYYSFKLGGVPTGNFNMFQAFEGTAQTGYVAMRSDVWNMPGWWFDVRQGAAGSATYHGSAQPGALPVAMDVGDVFTLKVGPTGSAAYKNGVMFDSTTVAPLGSLMLDAQVWHEPGTSATLVFDYIGVTDTAPIPEPGTLVLVATALIGLICYAWRKRK